MRRLARRLLNGLTALSLLLCVATAGLWVRSHWRADWLRHMTGDWKIWYVGSNRGTISVLYQSVDAGRSATAWDFHSAPAGQLAFFKPQWSHAGFSAGRASDKFRGPDGNTYAYTTCGVAGPHWAICLLLSILPCTAADRGLRRKTRQHRAAHGRCERCAYDLTGNISGVCPECGTIVKPEATDDASPTPASHGADAGVIAFADRHQRPLWVAAVFLPMAAVLTFLLWAINVRQSKVAAYALVPALALTVALGTAALQPVERRVRDRRRARFLSGRQPLSDAAFLAALGIDAGTDPVATKISLMARRTVAEMCGLAPEDVHPSDPMDVLWSMADELGAGDSVADLMMYVSKQAGVRFRRWGRPRPRTFGELARELPRWVAEVRGAA